MLYENWLEYIIHQILWKIWLLFFRLPPVKYKFILGKVTCTPLNIIKPSSVYSLIVLLICVVSLLMHIMHNPTLQTTIPFFFIFIPIVSFYSRIPRIWSHGGVTKFGTGNDILGNPSKRNFPVSYARCK
jgi:hypothetical protein